MPRRGRKYERSRLLLPVAWACEAKQIRCNLRDMCQGGAGSRSTRDQDCYYRYYNTTTVHTRQEIIKLTCLAVTGPRGGGGGGRILERRRINSQDVYSLGLGINTGRCFLFVVGVQCFCSSPRPVARRTSERMERATALRDDDYSLGTYSRKVSSKSQDAVQPWFDRGLVWTYSFNHEAAIRCFEVVLELDPSCAMAHWGIAYCNGINYNNQDVNDAPGRFPSNVDACKHARSALLQKQNAVQVEQDLIDALQIRCVEPIPASREDMQRVSAKYSEEMRKVFESHPDDPDVTTVYAESIMNIYPWDFWKGGKAREADSLFKGTAHLLEVLRSGIAKHPNHPGLLHLYLHAMEMAPNAGDCLPEANRLRTVTEDAGHLLHMPSHIDVVVGNYRDAIIANSKAIVANCKYIERNGAASFYLIYCCHDCHMKVYAGMLSGNQKAATEGAAQVREWLMREEVQTMMKGGLVHVLEIFVSMHMHAKVRFGQWQCILDEPLLPNDDMNRVSTVVYRYARCLAYAALKDVEKAAIELELLKEAYPKVPPTHIFFKNPVRNLLAIALPMAEGEVEYRRGNFSAAFDHLRQAVDMDDKLRYDEPWGWMQPVRHALGALLLEQGLVEEATSVYRGDLQPGRHPGNVWSLHGLAECLEKEPQLANDGELEQVKSACDAALKLADVPVKASCLCRLSKCH